MFPCNRRIRSFDGDLFIEWILYAPFSIETEGEDCECRIDDERIWFEVGGRWDEKSVTKEPDCLIGCLYVFGSIAKSQCLQFQLALFLSMLPLLAYTGTIQH